MFLFADKALFLGRFFDNVTPVNASIAQLVEHITDTDGVLGSNPSTRTRREPTQSVFL